MDSKLNIQDSKYKTQNLKIRLHVLSPIHIGCDDVYEPTSFVIDEQSKKLIEFDPMEFIRRLKPQETAEFSKTAAGDSLLAIFKMIKRFYKPDIKGREVEVTEHLIDHYKKILNMGTFDKKAIINQFTINKTAFNLQNTMPYIPGTSLKGALRTAYLSALAGMKKIENYPKDKAKELEIKLLGGSFDTDPFRMVKVSDLLPVGDISTKIIYAVNKKKKKSDKESLADKGGIYQIFETIQAGTVFEGMINIDKPENKSGINNPINMETLLLSAHRFYAGNLKQEITPLNESLNLKHKAGMAANAQFKDGFKQDVFLIRLGRHSGAEAVTIEGNRNIKIMQGRDKQPKFLNHATTLWLASDSPKPQNNNDLIPFGWAVLEVVQ
jgi:CRISPR-associated protein Csm5